MIARDIDCIGSSGMNMGFVEKNGLKVVVKIDPGFSFQCLDFPQDLCKIRVQSVLNLEGHEEGYFEVN